MSVILECQKGDAIFCIQEFHASPEGEPFSWDKSRKFRVGERLTYGGYWEKSPSNDNPSSVMIEFADEHGVRYSAAQNYFVTEDCWRGIAKYFARRVLRQQKPKQPITNKPAGGS